VSPFTCFHNAGGQGKAQKLLDNAFYYNGSFYNFDLANQVYVKFVLTGGVVYHGYDLSDDGNKVPSEVKSKFSKDGRVF
jgi:hypothetical protein